MQQLAKGHVKLIHKYLLNNRKLFYVFKFRKIAEKKLYDPACDDSPIGLTKKQRSVLPESTHNVCMKLIRNDSSEILFQHKRLDR